VTEALAVDPLALVGVEVAVHRRVVFVTGRIAAGGRAGLPSGLRRDDVAAWAWEVYDRAGYRDRWRLHPTVTTDLDVGPLGADEVHQLVVPQLAAAAAGLEGALPGVGSTFDPDLVRLNGVGDFTCGGPKGDNGLSGKKLVVDHYGPGVPIGGGALCGKDPHKVDRAGALAARQLAIRLVAGGHGRTATVWLGWLPGRETPDICAARVDGAWWDADRLAAAIPVPDLSIEGI